MRLLTWVMLSLLFVVTVVGSSREALAQGGTAGIVEEINGTVFWRKDRHVKKPQQLDPRFDRARLLHVGEEIKAGLGGSVRLVLCSGEKTIPPPIGWFNINGSQQCPNEAALRAYGRLGGDDRGEHTQIFSPSNHSVVAPDRFVIRWTPSPAKCKVTFAIKEIDGKLLWEEESIDESLGLWDSPNAKQVLAEYRSSGEQGPLLLKLTDSCANQVEITFSLLSVKSEASLKAELARWDQRSVQLMVHLGRASAFESYRMFSEVADEYEAALKVAPESRDLLKRAMLAHHLTGNFSREEELRRRLPSANTEPKSEETARAKTWSQKAFVTPVGP